MVHLIGSSKGFDERTVAKWWAELKESRKAGEALGTSSGRKLLPSREQWLVRAAAFRKVILHCPCRMEKDEEWACSGK